MRSRNANSGASVEKILAHFFMKNHTLYGYMEPKNFSNVIIKNNKSLDDVIEEIIGYILAPDTKKAKEDNSAFL